jgi:uncharacterized protein (DUF302 family)
MSVITSESPHDVRETTDRLVAALQQRGITVFARIDHAAGARAAGLELADEELLVFGDARVGTLLMQSDARVGYELPLRILVWDDGGRTRIGHRLPAELAEEYSLTGREEILRRMESLLAELSAQAGAA